MRAGAGARPSFAGLCASEFAKLATLPAIRAASAASILIAGGAAWLFSASYLSAAGNLDFADVALRGVEYAQAGLLVLGVIAIASEYPASIRTTLVTTPQRARVYLAKVVALVVCAVGTAVLAVVSIYGVSWIVLRDAPGIPHAGLDRFAAAGGYLVLVTLIAFAVGTAIRHTMAGVAVVLGYFFIAGPLLRQYAQLDWTPDVLGDALWYPVAAPSGIGVVQAWGALAAWVVALLAMAATAFRYRDA